jgi:hypothetical protein
VQKKDHPENTQASCGKSQYRAVCHPFLSAEQAWYNLADSAKILPTSVATNGNHPEAKPSQNLMEIYYEISKHVSFVGTLFSFIFASPQHPPKPNQATSVANGTVVRRPR